MTCGAYQCRMSDGPAPGRAGFRQSLQMLNSLSLRRFSTARARARSRCSSGARRTLFGFSDAFGFAVWTVAGFGVLRAREDTAFGLADVLVLRLGAGLAS